MLKPILPALKVSLDFAVLRRVCCVWEIQSRKVTPSHPITDLMWKNAVPLSVSRRHAQTLFREGKNLKTLSSSAEQQKHLQASDL